MIKPGAIERLRIGDYSQKPRVVEGVVGQNPGIRLIDFRDKTDMRRMRSIENNLGPEFLNTATTDSELIVQTQDGRPDSVDNDAQYMYGVAGLKGVDQQEVGELQGWVSFDAARQQDIDVLTANGVIPTPRENRHVLEIMYAKLPDAPFGQMASGIRQGVMKVASMDAERNMHLPHIGKPQLTIVARVEPKNTDSIRTLEAAGFVQPKKEPVHFPPEEEFPEFPNGWDFLVFVLDWRKFDRRMKKPVNPLSL